MPPAVLAQDTADPGTASERNVLYLPALGVYMTPEQTNGELVTTVVPEA